MGAYYWSIVLVVIGILILLLELFVPSAGILGIASVICSCTAIMMSHSFSEFSFIVFGIALLIFLTKKSIHSIK